MWGHTWQVVTGHPEKHHGPPVRTTARLCSSVLSTESYTTSGPRWSGLASHKAWVQSPSEYSSMASAPPQSLLALFLAGCQPNYGSTLGFDELREQLACSAGYGAYHDRIAGLQHL